jgi:hypothetical protein
MLLRDHAIQREAEFLLDERYDQLIAYRSAMTWYLRGCRPRLFNKWLCQPLLRVTDVTSRRGDN